MMLSNVTLEQLNAPTDLERPLRCATGESVRVYMEWSKSNEFGDWAEGFVNESWVRQRALELQGSREAAVATHEDEELMIRVKLDEGV